MSPLADRFDHVPGYLDTASIGLPPAEAADDLARAVEDWRRGRVRAQDYDPYVRRSRAAWARLVGVPTDTVAIGASVSVFVGMVAASLAPGSRVLVAAGDFTSVLFPFLAQAERRAVEVTEVDLDDLVASVGETVDLVAVSAVQSSDGRRLDVAALLDAAEAVGVRVLLDVTQACGWLPIDCRRVDYAVCAGYKWLLCPRGVAFMAVRADRLTELTPVAAGWYAGADVWSSIYGSPLRLAGDARRLDISPAWLSWVAAAPTLELLADLDGDLVRAHDVGLADRFRKGLGEPTYDSAIATVSRPDAADRLARAGVRASVRAGRVRASFHLYTTEDDVDRALDALTSHPS